jgi:hypothetical protein
VPRALVDRRRTAGHLQLRRCRRRGFPFLALCPRRPASPGRTTPRPATAGTGITAGPGPAARNASLAAAPAGSSHLPHPSPGNRKPPAARCTRAHARRAAGSGDPLASRDTPGKRRAERSWPASAETAGSPVNNTVHDTKPQFRRPKDRQAKDNRRRLQRQRRLARPGRHGLQPAAISGNPPGPATRRPAPPPSAATW